MHFRNGQLHGTTFDDKTLPTVAMSEPRPSESTSTFRRYYQGFSNKSNDYSASTLNSDVANDLRLVNIIDDENESETVQNYETSNDTERLIH